MCEALYRVWVSRHKPMKHKIVCAHQSGPSHLQFIGGMKLLLENWTEYKQGVRVAGVKCAVLGARVVHLGNQSIWSNFLRNFQNIVLFTPDCGSGQTEPSKLCSSCVRSVRTERFKRWCSVRCRECRSGSLTRYHLSWKTEPAL